MLQTHSILVTRTAELILYELKIAFCSKNHTKRVGTICGPNVQFFHVKPIHLVVFERLTV